MNRLREIRRSRGISQKQLADKLKVVQSAVSNWESGTRDMDSATLRILSDFFGVPVDHILGMRDVTSPTVQMQDDAPSLFGSGSTKGIKIPVLGRIQAGVPIEAVQEILDYEEITPEMASSGDFFALVIKGDSMEPRMREGDVVIVRKQPDVTSGDTVVVTVKEQDAIVRRLLKKEFIIMLQATNPVHEPLFFTLDQVRDLPVVVIGRVEELRAKF